MRDANAVLIPQGVVATGTITGAWLRLYAGTPFEGLETLLLTRNASTSSGAGSVSCTIQASFALDQSNPVTVMTFDPLTTGTTATGKEQIRRFEAIRAYWVRAVLVVAGTGGTTDAYVGIVKGDIP